MYNDDMVQASAVKEPEFTEKNKKRLERITRRARDWMNIYTLIFMQRNERLYCDDRGDSAV